MSKDCIISSLYDVLDIIKQDSTNQIVVGDKEFVLVVRCKDCKHNKLPQTQGNAMCELWYGMPDPNGYCPMGERREDES